MTRESMQAEAQGRDGRGQALARVTNEIVHLMATQYGKGPNRAYSSLSGDVVTCVMREALTTVERTLVSHGRSEEVRALRRGFQDAMAPRFVAIVEEVLGRRVEVFLSQVSLSPEVDVEVFILEPQREMPDQA